jgi:hypothetical protein
MTVLVAVDKLLFGFWPGLLGYGFLGREVLPPDILHTSVHITLDLGISVFVGMAQHHLIVPATVAVFGAIADGARFTLPRLLQPAGMARIRIKSVFI